MTRNGLPCQEPAMLGKQRYRMNGGANTGPRTKKGVARSTTARTKRGDCSPVEGSPSI